MVELAELAIRWESSFWVMGVFGAGVRREGLLFLCFFYRITSLWPPWYLLLAFSATSQQPSPSPDPPSPIAGEEVVAKVNMPRTGSPGYLLAKPQCLSELTYLPDTHGLMLIPTFKVLRVLSACWGPPASKPLCLGWAPCPFLLAAH